MGFASAIGPLTSLIGGAASGGKGGGGGGGSGVSPEEAMLAAYQAGQQRLKHAADFSSGMEMSTNLTEAQGGANIGQAMALSQIADQNAAQQNALNQQASQQLASNQNFSSGFNSQSNQGGTFNSPSNDASGGTLV